MPLYNSARISQFYGSGSTKTYHIQNSVRRFKKMKSKHIRIKGHLMKVRGRSAKVRVKGHLRRR